jgi:hypothetical protein
LYEVLTAKNNEFRNKTGVPLTSESGEFLVTWTIF